MSLKNFTRYLSLINLPPVLRWCYPLLLSLTKTQKYQPVDLPYWVPVIILEINYVFHFSPWPLDNSQKFSELLLKNSQKSHWLCGGSMLMWRLPPSLLGPQFCVSRLFALLNGKGLTRYFTFIYRSYFWKRSWLNYLRNLWDTEDTFLFYHIHMYVDVVGCQNWLLLMESTISTELWICPADIF